MQFTQLDPMFAVSPQIRITDVSAIAAAGFAVLVNNRPDGEASDQPSSADVAAEAQRHNLAYWYVPVRPGEDTGAQARRLAEILGGATGPVLAFCRSGARSTALWNAARRLP